MPRQNNIQFRKGTYSEWDAQATGVLNSGEPGFITDFNKLKIGDGSTQWSDLSAINDALTTLVYNGTSSTIPKMSVVYINGAQGDMPTVTLSIASGEMSSAKTYGITTGAISANGTGMVVVDGTLKNLNTLSGFSGVSPGTTLWLSPTVSGGITTTKPYAPNHMVALGSLVRVHSQQGVINVRIQNGFELEELHNVAISGVADGQFLYYDGSTSLWKHNSNIYSNGSNIGIGTAFPQVKLEVAGDVYANNVLSSGYLITNSLLSINDFDGGTPGTISVGEFTSLVQPYWTIDQNGSGNFSNLSVNDTIVSLSGHTHTSSDITNFNSSVSGLLPTIANSGDNRVLTSTGSSVGINAEANFTFNGSLLNVTGSGSFASGLNVANQTASTIASFDSSKNIVSLDTATYPSLTELSYIKGVTSSVQTQLNSKQNALTNPVTGTGVANHIPYWSSSSGLLSDSNQLVWDATNNRLGIGTQSPSVSLDVSGSGKFNAEDASWTFDSSQQRLGFVKKTGFVTYIVAGAGSPIVFAHSSSSNLGVSVTGQTLTERLYITSVGNVGIGTTSPLAKLHVSSTGNNDTILEYTNSTVGFNSGVVPLRLFLTVGNGAAVGAGVGLDLVTKSNGAEYIGGRIQTNRTDTSNNHALTFWAGGGTTALTEYMRIASNGNVGIGTASPSELLTVYGDNKYLYLQAQNNTGAAGIKFGNTAARQQMYIEATSSDLVIDSMNGGITESIRVGYNTGAVTINESGSDIDFRVEGDTDANLVFVDASADRVGIGTASPGYKLQVNGSFGATTKSFRIDHPSKEGYSLEYGSLESPYHGVRLTGRGKVVKGVGVVNLPDYLKDLIHDDESIVIQLTNYKHGKTLYVDKIDLKNDKFVVKADRAKTLGELEFFWTLTGTRKDVDHLVVEKRN